MALTDHRTMRPLLAFATIGTLCLGLAACGGSDSPTVVAPTADGTSATSTADPTSPSTSASSSSDTSPGSSSAPSSPSSTDTTSAVAFAPGQCIDDTTNWQVIPCSRKHELEIMSVVKTTKDADDIVKRGVLRTWTCNNEVAAYVGSPSGAFSRILDQAVPAAADPNAAEQIVCAIGVAKPDDSGYEEITYGLKNRLKQTGYTDYRICTSDRPSKTDSPHIVPCSRPHKAETIGGYVIGAADGTYPGSAEVDKRALKKCVPLAKSYLGGTRGDVIAAVNSTGREGWKRGTTLTACFVEATQGTFGKPLQGIKNKPLSQYR